MVTGTVACTSDDDGIQYGTIVKAMAPAGSDAMVVSHNVPLIMAPGEAIPIRVEMRNTGAASPANDWNSPDYRLTRLTTVWGWGNTRVTPPNVRAAPFNEVETFLFAIRAPAVGPVDFRAQMASVGAQSGFFGEILDVPNITINPARVRQFDCGYVSDTLPASMAPGAVVDTTITVENTGTAPWPDDGSFCLYTRDTPGALWGPAASCSRLRTVVPGASESGPGGTHTFNLRITAPMTPGIYELDRQILGGNPTSGGPGFFDLLNNCVDRSIEVLGGVAYDADFDTDDSTIDEAIAMAPGERRVVTVTMENTGQLDWTTDFQLLTQNIPGPLWGLSSVPVSAVTSNGNSFTFTFQITAPTNPNNYRHQWRMFGPGVGFFGESVNILVNVDPGNPRAFDAAVDNITIPAAVGPNRMETFRVTMRNTGTSTWTGPNVSLTSDNTPFNLWGVGNVPLGPTDVVGPGQSFQFSFMARAPSAPGTYQSRWRMSDAGIGPFGQPAVTTVDVVQSCGNGVTQPAFGEECDDQNLVDGDGCSSACLIESTVIDLAVTSSSVRTFYGVESAKSFSQVAIGDLTGDGTPDLAMGGAETAQPTGQAARFRAGVVRVQSGGFPFFDGSASSADMDATLTIWGERAYDEVGSGAFGGVLIADLVGDNTPDLVLSSNAAACMDGNDNCGRVYVIEGGTTLPTGILDLAVATSSTATVTAVAAVLVAPSDGDSAQILSAGDATGDGITDLLIGLPGANGGAGRVVVVAGGASLTGTIELTTANVAAEILPVLMTDNLGRTGIIGEIDADPNAADVIVGSSTHDSATGGADAGGAWAIYGPLAGTYDLSVGAWNVRWLGAGIRDGLGSDFAVGDVLNNGNPDILIGIRGTRDGGNVRRGSVEVFSAPVANGATFDYALGVTADAQLLGEDAGGGLGSCVETADLSGDGKDDIVTSAPFTRGIGDSLIQAGQTMVVLGDADLTDVILGPATPLTIFANESRARMCFYPNGLALGDLDQDGNPDVCMGSPGANVPGSGLVSPGRVDCIRTPW